MSAERIAVLESRLKRMDRDVGQLYKFFREHMETEEKDRKNIIKELGQLNSTLATQKSFWSGMVFTFAALGALLGGWVSWLKATGGG